jgi:hypothetical protein
MLVAQRDALAGDFSWARERREALARADALLDGAVRAIAGPTTIS